MNIDQTSTVSQLERRRPGVVLSSFEGAERHEIELEPGLILVGETAKPADRSTVEAIASALAD